MIEDPSSVAVELVEVVDEAGTPIRTVSRAEMRLNRLRHRAVFVVVTNSANELLVHQRSDLKDLWPGRWDIAAGGVCALGETWEHAAARELKEELGITAHLQPLADVKYSDDEVSLCGRVFRVRHDGPCTFEDGEVQQAKWIPGEALGSFLADHLCCPDSATVIPRLLRHDPPIGPPR